MGIAAITQSTDGSEASFRTQTLLDNGFTLEDLLLRYDGGEAKKTELTFKAWGFGDADPSQRARLDLKLDGPWHFSLGYDRRESFFGLRETELGSRSDDWQIDRWQGSLEWDGWKAARLGLDLRAYDRSGTVQRPIFGLNELYPLAVELDETMREVAFRLETRDLPVRILFEQALATYERANRRRPAGSLDLEGDDPDLFVLAADTREEEREVPTTRVVATWGNPRVEVAASLLWSPADLEGSGRVSEGFDIAGGAIGRVEFIDELVSSADLDTFAGSLRLGFRLAAQWVLRLEADLHDRSTDATLLGERLLRVTDPFGNPFELSGLIDESSLIEVEDDHQRLTLEWSDGRWTVWGGGFSASRDVDWRLSREDPGFEVTRDSDGILLGAAWSHGPVEASAEWQQGDFDKLVFRTDPECVDRLTLRLRADLGSGWNLSARGRFEQADNPREAGAVPGEVSGSGLDRSSDSFGLGLGWSSGDGETGFGLDLDQVDLTTDTDLSLPDGTAGLSRYDLSLLTTTLHGRTRHGRARLSGSVTRLDDSGDTWPVESWIARARVGVEVARRTEVAVFGEYWSYDEARADGDDYDVSRVGLALHWRFE